MKHVHGGNIYTYKNCLDFSANCNPLGTPESVKQAVRDSLDHLKDYPQVGYAPLKEAIAAYEDVKPEHIICGNGAAELVFSLCHALRPKRALIPVPTFAEYEQALESVGAQVEHVLLKEEEEFRVQDSFIDWLHKDLDMTFSATRIIRQGCLRTGNFCLNCSVSAGKWIFFWWWMNVSRILSGIRASTV